MQKNAQGGRSLIAGTCVCLFIAVNEIAVTSKMQKVCLNTPVPFIIEMISYFKLQLHKIIKHMPIVLVLY